jgi:hypothetical protein
MTSYTKTALLSVLTIALTVASAAANARSARADALEIDDKDRATLRKEEMKQRRTGDDKVKGLNSRQSGDKCGNVDIGNSSDDKRGSSRIAERSKTVIVTGNVYNTAKCK